jgi:hypothetical protein
VVTGCNSWYQSQRILKKKSKKKNSPSSSTRFGFLKAMYVSARTTVVALSVTTVTLDQMLTRWKWIDELLKSTDASLAWIGRLQNPREPLLDFQPRRLEAREKVLQASMLIPSMSMPLVLMPTIGSTSSIGLAAAPCIVSRTACLRLPHLPLERLGVGQQAGL